MMTTIEKLEQAVAEARAAYVKERDARRPDRDQWDRYVWLLHAMRLHKRGMKHGGST